MGLEVQALAGRVRSDQDAQRVFLGIGVEGAFQFLSLVRRRGTVEDLDTLVGAVGAFGCGLKLLSEVTLRIVVFREDDHPHVVPFGRRCRLVFLCTERQVRAHVFANPVDQLQNASVGPAASRFGNLCHLIEKLLFACEQSRGVGVGGRCGALGRGGFDLGVFFGLQFLFTE